MKKTFLLLLAFLLTLAQLLSAEEPVVNDGAFIHLSAGPEARIGF